MKFGNYMEGTCHLRGPRKSVDFWGVDRLGGAFASEGGGSRSILSNF